MNKRQLKKYLKDVKARFGKGLSKRIKRFLALKPKDRAKVAKLTR